MVLKANIFGAVLLLLCIGCTSKDGGQKAGAWSDPADHKNGFVTANGIRLNYLDWGGTGPTLILIHGFGDNPHVFDDIAPAFTDRFHVFAYARRGHGLSDATGPYSLAALTGDLRRFMDALGITRANLAGWSMGGNEITAMAGLYPERVDRIVYLEGAYDWADSAFAAGFTTLPTVYMQPPAGALASLDGWRAYQKKYWLPSVSDTSIFEAYVRELGILQPDGSVLPRMRAGTTDSLATVLLTAHRDYSKVHSPALAIYSETFIDLEHGDSAFRATNLLWENRNMLHFRKTSVERIRKELPNVEIVNVPGTHMSFIFTSRAQVVEAMRKFLSGKNN